MGTKARRVLAAVLALVVIAVVVALGPCSEPTLVIDSPTSPGDARDAAGRVPRRRAGDVGSPADGAADAESDAASDGESDGAANPVWDDVPTREPDAWKGDAAVLVRRADTKAPIGGATVRAVPVSVGDAAPDATAPREVVTGPDGTARAPLWSGGTRAVVRCRGFLPGRIESLRRDDRAGPSVVELVPGVPLAGRVVLADGTTPVAGATVHAWADRFGPAFDDPVTTDADGRFEFTGAPPDGEVQVAAAAPSFAAVTVTSVPADPRAPVRIVLGVGASIAGTVRDVRGAPVAGADVFVLDARERRPPLPDALAGDERIMAELGRARERLAFLHLRAGPDGSYRAAGLRAPESYVVWARDPSPLPEPLKPPRVTRSAPDGTDVGEDWDDPDAEPPPPRWAEGRSAPVTLARDERRLGVDVVVAATATVRVTVTRPDGSVVVDRTADVTLDGARREVPREHDLDLEEGFALFERVFPGAHTVFVEADGHPGAKAAVSVAAGEHVEVTIRLVGGATVVGRIVDGAGVPVVRDVYVGFSTGGDGGEERYVSGTVAEDGAFVVAGLTDAPGDLYVNAKGFVGVERDGIAPGADLGTIVLRRAARVVGVVPAALRGRNVTIGSHAYDGSHGGSESGDQSEDGRFEIGDLPPDTPMEVYVAVEGAAPVVLENVVLRAGETRDLGTLKFPAAVELAGVVLGADGAPLRGAEVDCAESWAPDGQQRTDAEGRFLVPGLVPKQATFRVEAAGYPRTWVEIDLRQASAPVSIRLARGGVLRGRIDLPEGTRLPEHTHIDAYPLGADGKPVEYHYHEFDLDGVGAFETRLPAGRYVLGFHRGRPPTEPMTVEVTEGGTTEAVLEPAK